MNVQQRACLVSISFVSWLVGVATYIVFGYSGFGDGIGSGDIAAVIFWTPIPSVLAFLFTYAPCMLILRHILKGNKPIIVFPLVAALLFIIPTALVAMLFAGIGPQLINALLSPEAVLFCLMFIAVGITFGLGFAWFYPDAPADNGMHPTAS